MSLLLLIEEPAKFHWSNFFLICIERLFYYGYPLLTLVYKYTLECLHHPEHECVFSNSLRYLT
jgi:hypothetical protein